MAVSTAYAPILVNWTSTNQAISVTWPFFTGTIKVTEIASTGTETVKSLTTHYTVSGGTSGSTGLPGTGTVTMVGAATSGSQLKIERVTPRTQATEFSQAGAFAAKTVEAALDRLTLIAAEIAYDRQVVWEGGWVSGNVYAAGDFVSNDGSMYYCIADHTAGASTEPGTGASWEDYWELAVSIGDAGADGATIYVQASAPATSGPEGSLWIDSDSTDVDVYVLTSGSWVDSGANLRGPTGPGSGDLLSTNNLSDLANAGTARGNLGLGSIATQAASNVAITGGTIGGVTLTGTLSGGTFTSTTLTSPTINSVSVTGTPWHSGNDGTGSGLDADTVDGVQANAFAQLSGAAFTGDVGLSATNQPPLNLVATGGSSGNQRTRWVYDGGVSLSQGGWVFQRLSDAGVFEDNLIILFNDGAINATGSLSHPGARTIAANSFIASGHTVLHAGNYTSYVTNVSPTASGSGWPVGSWCLAAVTSGSVNNNNTIAGSSLVAAYFNTNLNTGAGALSGTWKNISGITISPGNAGFFVRTA